MMRLSEFLRPSHRSNIEMKTASIESKLQRMVMERYYELKYSTKTEFIHSLDNLMTGEVKVSHSVFPSQDLLSLELFRASECGFMQQQVGFKWKIL